MKSQIYHFCISIQGLDSLVLPYYNVIKIKRLLLKNLYIQKGVEKTILSLTWWLQKNSIYSNWVSSSVSWDLSPLVPEGMKSQIYHFCISNRGLDSLVLPYYNVIKIKWLLLKNLYIHYIVIMVNPFIVKGYYSS